MRHATRLTALESRISHRPPPPPPCTPCAWFEGADGAYRNAAGDTLPAGALGTRFTFDAGEIGAVFEILTVVGAFDADTAPPPLDVFTEALRMGSVCPLPAIS